MPSGTLIPVLRAYLAKHPTLPALDDEGYEAAVAHRLAGTVYHIRPPMSEKAREAARAGWLSQSAAHLRRVSTLAQRWPSGAPAPLIFKGGDLTENIFRDPGARRSSDLDLLVPPEDWETIAATWARSADEVTTARVESLPGDHPYDRGFRFGGVLLELHRAPQPEHRGGPSGSALWSRGREAQLEGLAVRYPEAVDRFVLWVLGQAKNSFCTDLADQLDGACILRSFGDEAPFPELIQRCRDADLEAPLALALLRLKASGLWEQPLPALGGPTVQAIAALLPRPDEAPTTTPRWRFQLMKLWSTPSDRRAGLIRRLLETALRASLRASSPARR